MTNFLVEELDTELFRSPEFQWICLLPQILMDQIQKNIELAIAFSVAFGHQRLYINRREINIYLCQSTLLAGIPQFYLTKSSHPTPTLWRKMGHG